MNSETRKQLDDLYRRLLGFGLLNVRQAIQTKDYAWAEAEAEFLHNIPSLIGETNPHRHRFFWDKERPAYLDWVSQHPSSEAGSKVKIFYKTVFVEMEPIQAEMATLCMSTV